MAALRHKALLSTKHVDSLRSLPEPFQHHYPDALVRVHAEIEQHHATYFACTPPSHTPVCTSVLRPKHRKGPVYYPDNGVPPRAHIERASKEARSVRQVTTQPVTATPCLPRQVSVARCARATRSVTAPGAPPASSRKRAAGANTASSAHVNRRAPPNIEILKCARARAA